MGYTRTWSQTVGGPRPGATIGRVSEVIIHTEAGAALSASASLSQEAGRLRDIHAFHRRRGWAGFGYSAMSCQSGRTYEGRGAFRSGAHTQGRNRRALAIVVPGHGDRTAMSEACIAGCRQIIAHWIAIGALTADFRVSGHRDYAAKSCPGNRIYPQLGRLRGVTAAGRPTPTPPPPDEDDDMTDAERKMLTTIYEHVTDRDRQGRLHREVRVTKEAVGRIEQLLDGRKVGQDLRAIRLAVRGLLAIAGIRTRNKPPDVYDV